MSGPSCRNTAIDDDLDLSDALSGRVAQILPNAKTYASLIDVVDSFAHPAWYKYFGCENL